MFALFSRNAGMSGLIYLSHDMLGAPGCIHGRHVLHRFNEWESLSLANINCAHWWVNLLITFQLQLHTQVFRKVA